MYSEEMRIQQREWSERALFLMRELLPFMGKLGRFEGLAVSDRARLGWLATAAARSTESAFLLMAYGQLWDAEVMLRSVFESSLKFAFILQSGQDFRGRFEEYSEDMFQLSRMKDDQKARDVLNQVSNPDATEWNGIRGQVLPDAEREKLRARFDKPTRRAMETRWGYAGLLDSLSKSGDPLYKKFSALSAGYSLASHIHHADYAGVSIAMEREERSDERRDALHRAHLGRLISDCFTCFQIRLVASYRFVGADPSELDEVSSRINRLRDYMRPAFDHWSKLEYGENGD